MKIGIVSAQKHCKTHLRQLTQDGHDVVCLGARPAQIPPSYDALVIRIASMRHCEAYKQWAKDTGRPVIYEDGLSGIRRELAKIPTSQPKLATAAISVQDVRDRMVEWGAALVEARPQDNRNTISRHLTSTLNAQFPSMAANSKALVSSVMGELFSTIAPPPPTLVNPPKDTASTADPVVLEPSVPVDHPTQLRPFPSPENPWCKVYTEVKCELAYEQAIEYLGRRGTRARADLCREFKRVEKGHKMPKTFVKKMEPHVRGKPLKFVMLVYLALPEDHAPAKKALIDAYRQITGKGSDTRLWKATEWFLGRETPVRDLRIGTPPNPEPQGLQPGPDAFSPRPTTRTPTVAVTEPAMDNTQTIVGLLDTVERMEGQIKDLEGCSRRTSSWGLRIKSLEAGIIMDPEGEAEWKERFAQMEEDLRGDISDAFDALAAEQQPQTLDLSSNPFAALDQVKAALKAAGFKGTLTLTIE